MVNVLILDMRVLSDGMVGSCSDDTAKIPLFAKKHEMDGFRMTCGQSRASLVRAFEECSS